MNQDELIKLVNVAGEFLTRKAPDHTFVIILWGPDGKASIDNLPQGQELATALATIGFEMQANQLRR